ncbi:MAG: hypothetical protein U0167_06185 [bacterium]
MITRARRAGRIVAVVAAAASVIALGGCESRRAAERRAEQAQAATAMLGNRPQALMIHYQAAKGTGFAREGWELEILQLGGDVRLEGSIRSGAQAGPVYGKLSEPEYAELYAWISGLPLAGFHVQEDSTAADEGWRKSLDVDIVLGPDRRILARNKWTRRAAGAPWLDELEQRLHRIALEHRTMADTGHVAPDSTRQAVEKALRAAHQDLGDSTAKDAPSSP